MKSKITAFISIILMLLALAACDMTGSTDEPPAPGGLPDGNIPECTAHSYEYKTYIEASCSEPAMMMGTCTVCEKVIHIEGEKDPEVHRDFEWRITREPNCTEVGKRDKCCIYCGAVTQTEQIATDPEKHELTVVDEHPATCAEVGTLFMECVRCAFVEEETIPIDINAHLFNGELYINDDGHAPLCHLCHTIGTLEAHTLDGLYHNEDSHYNICSVCNGAYDVHAHDWATVTVDPTYLEPGYSYFKCDVCGEQTEPSEINPLPPVTPEYTVPQGIVAVYGSHLNDISLPEGFSFYYADTTVGTVGEHIHYASYAPPNNEDGKYCTVYGIEITVTVIPLTIEIECDTSALSSLVYNGEPVPTPQIAVSQQHIAMQISWYCGEELLDGAPCDAGEYRMVVTVTDKNYTSEPLVHSFTVERAEATVNTDFITDRGYTGYTVSFDLPDGVSVTYSDKDGEPIGAPSELGDYFVTVYMPGSKNYMPFEVTLPFSVVVDTEAPVWPQTYVYLPTDTKTYTLDATDNGRVAYYHVCAYTRSTYEMSFVTSDPVIEVSVGEMFYISAIDMAGNVSEDMYVYVQPDVYLPTEVTPSNGATVSTSYVELRAENATYYYIGTSPDGEFERLDTRYVLSLKSGQTYYWYASCGYTNSPTYTFTVRYDGDIPPTLIYPEDNATVTDSIVNLVGTSSNGATVFIASEQRPDFFYEYTASQSSMIYGAKYFWYVEDADGNRSEVRQLLYMGNYGSKESDLAVYISKTEHAYTHVVVRGYGTVDPTYVTYTVRGADGTLKIYNSTSELKYKGSDGLMSASLRDLENGDTVHVRVKNDFLSYSTIKTFRVDTEVPRVGEISVDDDGNVTIGVGSDNVGATYEYRIGCGEWISYTSTILLSKESLAGQYPYFELRAYDAAGNISTSNIYLGEGSENAPEITVTGVTGKLTNENVTVYIDTDEKTDDYYFINGERFRIEVFFENVFSEDGEYVIWTSTVRDGVEEFSSPIRIMIDKTAPKIGDLYYQPQRMSNNNEYHYVCLDPNAIVESSEFEISYMVREINPDFKPYETNGRVPLYSYFIAKSGYYHVDIAVTDAAGNRAIETAVLFIDVEGPVISKGAFKYEYDEQTGETKCYIIFENIYDEDGYYYHMHFLIWNQDPLENAVEAIESISFFTEPGESSFIYDASDLPDGTTYYFLAYVVDDLINATYSDLYYFEKQAQTPETAE